MLLSLSGPLEPTFLVCLYFSLLIHDRHCLQQSYLPTSHFIFQKPLSTPAHSVVPAALRARRC